MTNVRPLPARQRDDAGTGTHIPSRGGAPKDLPAIAPKAPRRRNIHVRLAIVVRVRATDLARRSVVSFVAASDCRLLVERA